MTTDSDAAEPGDSMTTTEPVLERVAGHIGWRRDLLPESKAEAMEQARLILREVADHVERNCPCKAFGPGVADWIREQAAEEGADE